MNICKNVELLMVVITVAFTLSCSMLVTDTTPSGDSGEIVVFEDFEDGSYSGWVVTGTAFGDEPHTGASPNQLRVHGFLGERLVNSYLPSDESTGTMISDSFTITHPYIGFLIGGGDHEGKTCMNLVVEGEVVRSKTGNRSDQLTLAVWDVKEYIGKNAVFEIVDAHSGGWGHVNIDHIFFCNKRPEPEYIRPQ